MAKKAETKEVEKEEQRDERKAYFERKKELMEEEENNFSKIIFLRGTKGYWLVGGHSAVILVNKLAQELRIRIALKRDTDFDYKFSEGVINLKNLDFYKEKLVKSVYLKPEVVETEDRVVFELIEKISETEYDLLLRSKEIRRQKLQGMIEKSVPMPKLNLRLTDVLRLTYKFYVKHSDAFSRTFVVQKLADDIRVAHKTMLLVFREQIPAKEGIKKIKAELEMGLCDLSQIIALDLWSVEDCTALSALIIETQLIADAEYKRFEKKEAAEQRSVKKVKEIIKKNG